MQTRFQQLLLIAFILAPTTTAFGQETPVLEWAKAMGGTSFEAGSSIAIDASDNVFTTGVFQGTSDLDPGTGAFNLTSAGGSDIFISKLDASGNFVWAVQLGGTGSDEAFSITTDAAGNVFTTGYFQGTVDFDPGAATFNLTSAGGDEVFISKLDASGNFVWAKRLGSANIFTDAGLSIAIDATGNVLTTGYFVGTCDFDPGTGNFDLTAAGALGSTDIFISKLDASGNFVWAKQMGGTGFDLGNSVTFDAAGNVFTTGYFNGTADFDPGATAFNLTAASSFPDIFISKLDASGNFVWAKQMGGANNDRGISIATDASGNLLTTGLFSATVDFDPGTGTFNLSSAGNTDIFISKVNASGNFVWAKQLGGTGNDLGNSIATDASGNVFTTGRFQATSDFDPGTGAFNLTSAGGTDIFISKLDASGNFVWATSTGGTSNDIGNSITTDASGNVFTTGIFEGTIDFDPGAGAFNLTSAGGSDIFVYKLSQSLGAPPTITNFTPASGPVGTTVTITGTNFSTIPGNNIVYFGATRAAVTGATVVQLTAIVPTGATYSPITVLNIASGLLAYSMSNFTPTFSPIKGTITNGDFEPKIDFATGTLPFSVAIGDLDGDGRADLAVANASSASLSIFRNSGSAGTIGYAPKVDLVTGTSPFSVSIGDLDGDGRPDLAVANQGSATVSVFRNTSTTGSISYEPKVDFATGGGPSTTAIGDLNGDGKADLATANFFTNNISVFRNTSSVGAISYAPKVDFAAGIDPYPLSIGDLDGDGKPDIVVANQTSNTVSAFHNTSSAGTISYAPRVDFTTGTNPTSVSVGDLDGDGKADLAVANGNSNSVSVFRSTGSAGTISYAAKVDFATGTAPAYVSMGDLNGDGKVDMAITNNSDATVSVFRNTGSVGTINYAAKVDFATGTSPAYVSIGDLDGDEKPDLAVANYNSGTVSVIRNSSPATITSFTPASGPIGTTVTITGTNFSTTPANNIVYFGAVRATVTAATATQLTVAVPTGATYQAITVSVGGLTAHAPRPFVVTFAGGGNIDTCSFGPQVNLGTNTGTVIHPSLADVDGDGKPDLITTDINNDIVSIRRNISTPGTISTGSFESSVDLPTGDSPLGAIFGDLDSDGRPDLAVVNYLGGQLSVFKNLSTPGAIAFAPKVDFPVPSFVDDAQIADIDGDGKQDLTITHYAASALMVLRNTGTPGVINASSFAAGVNFTTGPNPYPFALGDMDGDGKLDAAVPNGNQHSVSVLRNTSTPGTVSFAPQIVLITAPGTPVAGQGALYASLGDLDGDNKLDLAVTNNTTFTISVFRNISMAGSLSFDPKVDLVSTDGSAHPRLSDLDGDGKVDLAVDVGFPAFAVYKNTGASGTIAFNAPITFPKINSAQLLEGDIDGDGRNDIVSCSVNILVFRNLIGTISLPTITSFAPLSGDVGTSVTLTGTGLSTPFANAVTFNGVPAVISGSTATTLTVTVPAGATTGLIGATIGCNTVTSGSNFDVCSSPAPPSTFSSSICGPGIVPLSASGGVNGDYTWYSVPTGGTPIAGAVNSIFNTPSISVTTVFYVTLRSGSCESTRTAATATIIPLPASPGATQGTGCAPSAIVVLNASGGSAGEYRWYTVASGGSPIPGETSGSYTTPVLSATTTYYVSIDNGTCESLRVPVEAQIRSCTPVIAAATAQTPVGTPVSINIALLVTVISDPIDIASIKVITQPLSGATATIVAGVLEINYSGVSFAGTDRLTIEACDLAGHCAQQEITIEVIGEITVYNALSPNGDGKNDVFYIQYINALPETQQNKVTILNRWGTVVFETTNYDNTSNVFKGLSDSGAELPSGTYYYILEFMSGEEKRTGYISLRK